MFVPPVPGVVLVSSRGTRPARRPTAGGFNRCVRRRTQATVVYRPRTRDLIAAGAPQRPVMTLPLQELLMAPAFGDAPLDEHDDRRALWNRVVAVCGEQDDLGFGHLSEQLEDRALSLRVETGHRLIE